MKKEMIRLKNIYIEVIYKKDEDVFEKITKKREYNCLKK